MQTKINDNCQVQFKDLKFRKIPARFIVYKIDHEEIVPRVLNRRLWRELERRNKHGNRSWGASRLRSSGSVFSISSSRMLIIWKLASWCSLPGIPMEHH